MTNIAQIKEGDVELIHHSTSSLFQLVITDEEGGVMEVWLNYNDIKALKNILKKIIPND